MSLFITSLIAGFIGMNLGAAFGGEVFAFLFGFLGVLSPALLVLQQMNRRLEKLEKKRKVVFNVFKVDTDEKGVIKNIA
ncbi:MAG: hypothetical protein JJT76_10835 [Clostridiaceae bacterium]|nr:hypothetical protein [Clostridiaceae bacterium]